MDPIQLLLLVGPLSSHETVVEARVLQALEDGGLGVQEAEKWYILSKWRFLLSYFGGTKAGHCNFGASGGERGYLFLYKKNTVCMRLFPLLFLSQSVSRGTEKRGC